MRTYANTVTNKFVTETNGTAGAGALVTVYTAGSTVKAPLFDVLGAAITNPLQADDEGNYSFKVADGIYDLVINESALSETRIDRLQIAEIIGFNSDTAHYSDLVTAQAANLTVSTIITTAGYYATNDGGGAQYVVVAGGTGAVDGGQYINMINGNQLELIIDGRVNAKTFGVIADGVTDISVPFIAAIKSGLPITFTNGDYFISPKGANTDGITITDLTIDLDISCEEKAVFIAGVIDGDMIRITVPSTGAGLPSEKLNWKWAGGTFDQRNQKNSTVTPYSAQFPPVNVGTSATADGLYMVCHYDDGGGSLPAVDSVIFEGITTIGSYDHWTLAGGDSGLFCAGATAVDVINCRDFGQRDAGSYISGESNTPGQLQMVSVHGCQSYASCNGITVKRGGENVSIYDNHATNTLLPISLQYIDLVTIGGGVYGNTSTNAWRAFRLDKVTGVNIFGNTARLLGHTMSNGGPDLTTFTYGVGIDCEGVVGCSITNNVIKDKNPLYTSATFGDAILMRERVDTSTKSNNNIVSNNVISGIHDAGNDEAGLGGADNLYCFNSIFDCTVNRFIIGDSGSIIAALSDGALLTLGDGTDRSRATFTQIGGLELKSVLNINGDNIVGSRRTGWSSPTGTQSKQTFDPATVTTEQLAQRVGALIDDLSSISGGHGLIGA